MKRTIKATREIMTAVVAGTHTIILGRTIMDNEPTVCDGEDELIESIVEKTLALIKIPITEYNMTYPDESFICGYDNRGIGFKQPDGVYVENVRVWEFDLNRELKNADDVCDAIARKLNLTVCDDNAIVIYLEDTKQIRILPPSGAYHLINKQYEAISSSLSSF